MAIPVLNIEQIRAWENSTWESGISQEDVIKKAGAMVAYYAEKMTSPCSLILGIGGKGHNGDDTEQAINQIKNNSADFIRISDPIRGIEDLKSLPVQKYSLIIDGLFGIGLNRPLDEKWSKLIDFINELRIPILSVDIPSGVNADTGEIMGRAISATATVTLGAVKQGLLNVEAAKYVGRLYVAPEIGLKQVEHISTIWYTSKDDFCGFPPSRNVVSHKGTYGHLVIIAGSVGYHGAAVIAAKAAQQSQPGLITLITLADSYIPVASQLSAVMVHPWRPSLELPENTTGIVIGPGLASSEIPPGLVDFVVKLWDQFPGPVCVDASALDWLPEKSISSKAPRIITPHPGEAARMLKTTTQKVLSNRFETVRSLSKRFGNTWVVLKGHQSLIGNFNGIIYVNSTGNPWLAQGGAGDALAGFLGGLIAQPQLQSDILKTIRYAVWKHGLTADYMQSIKTGWTIEELTQHLGKKFTDNEFILKVC